jgi:predicted enzyme related to lactoylglutathione lyase
MACARSRTRDLLSSEGRRVHGDTCDDGVAKIVWRDLVTPRAAEVAPFYRDLLGWELTEPEPSGYRHFRPEIGGLVERDVRPHWLPYVAVAELEATIAKATELDAKLLLEPVIIPAGRFALLVDPWGAAFAPFELGTAEPKAETPVRFAWDELVTSEPATAIAFYAELFGWEHVEERGSFPVLAIDGQQFADVVESAEAQPVPPGWLPYAAVADVDATAAKAIELGGKALVEPTRIPNVPYFAVLADPAGAAFGVFAPA